MAIFPISVGADTANEQRWPDLARLNDGSFVAAWTSDLADGSGYGVLYTIFNPDGTRKFAGDFLVNTFATGNQQKPEITVLESGNFVIAWESDGQDGSGLGIYGRLFDRDGAVLTPELRLSGGLTQDQSDHKIAALGNGGFVLTYTDDDADPSGNIMQAQYSAFGARIGGFDTVNPVTAGSQRDSGVIGLDTGGWAVTYVENATQELFLRVYSASGTGGAPVQVHAGGGGSTGNPEMALLSDGNIVVTYRVAGDSRYRIFQPDGTPVIGEQIVAGGALTDFPNVVALDDGGFALSWVAFPPPAQEEIRLQSFDADGTARGSSEAVSVLRNTAFIKAGGLVELANGTLGVAYKVASNGGDVVMVYDGPTGFDDIITGSDALDLDLLGGDDFLTATSANNVILGGDGIDTIKGGGGNDDLSAGRFAFAFGFAFERLEGANGDDTLTGSAGQDILLGGAGSDLALGRGGNDRLDGGSSDEVLRGGAGDDTVLGGTGSDAVGGGAGDDIVDGGTGNDRVQGNDGNDTLKGGAGSDQLRGGDGDDVLNGGNGSDILIGGAGDDVITGGVGFDIFWFNTPDFGSDVITAWEDGADLINMRNSGAFSLTDLVITDVGSLAVIEFGQNSIEVIGGGGLITAVDFIF